MAAKLYVLVAAAGLVSGPMIAFSSAPPVMGELVLIMGPDTTQREQLVHKAGGRVIGPKQAMFGSFAVSDDPKFAEKLTAFSGVWFVVDGRQIARLCGVEL